MDRRVFRTLPYFDEDLERLYAFLRHLSRKLPPPGDGRKYTLDDDVALKFFRLQQVNEGAIGLAEGEADPLKGPTDVGTAMQKDACGERLLDLSHSLSPHWVDRGTFHELEQTRNKV